MFDIFHHRSCSCLIFCVLSLGLYISLHFIYLLFIFLCPWLSSCSYSFYAWDSLNDSHQASVYSCCHYNLFILWKLNVDYPSISDVRVFKKLWITHLLNMLLKLWITHFSSKFWFTYFFGHVHFKRRNSFVHGKSSCYP